MYGVYTIIGHLYVFTLLVAETHIDVVSQLQSVAACCAALGVTTSCATYPRHNYTCLWICEGLGFQFLLLQDCIVIPTFYIELPCLLTPCMTTTLPHFTLELDTFSLFCLRASLLVQREGGIGTTPFNLTVQELPELRDRDAST